MSGKPLDPTFIKLISLFRAYFQRGRYSQASHHSVKPPAISLLSFSLSFQLLVSFLEALPASLCHLVPAPVPHILDLSYGVTKFEYAFLFQ